MASLRDIDGEFAPPTAVAVRKERSQRAFQRNIHGILGIPVDVIDLSGAVEALRAAAVAKQPYQLSTPNLNFLIQSQVDPEFRETLLASDLCPADGMPIVWIARL